MKRYLFLDIDGVCNHDDWYHKNHIEGNWKCGDIDPATVALLNQLKDLDVKVVISSSWGTRCYDGLRACGLELPIIGHTDQIYCEWMCRGNEIMKWLYQNHIEEHIDDTYEYVILDDIKEMLMEQEDNFIWVDPKHGLKQKHIDEARDIFGGAKWNLEG